MTRSLTQPRLAMIATYPPRRCGIATFTHDLRSALVEAADDAAGDAVDRWPHVVALDHGRGDPRTYPNEVVRRLPRDRAHYAETGQWLASDGAEVVSLQHEFGIFGGPAGRGVLDLVDALSMPAVTTLHTVLEHPQPLQRAILATLIERSARVVVMSDAARRRLGTIYGADDAKLAVVPHGVPRIPRVDPIDARRRLGLPDEPMIVSFGLLSPAKRLELVIDALGEIRSQAPTARLVILGATHPEVKRRRGEEYRRALIAQVDRLGLNKQVSFVDRFVEADELIAWLRASDIFVTPYSNAEQASSGTLSLAAAAACACVSTPYEHARELLGDGRGVLVPFNDVPALADAFAKLLNDPDYRAGLGARAHRFAAARMAWPAVAAQYASLFADAVHDAAAPPIRARLVVRNPGTSRPPYHQPAPLAAVRRDHLDRLETRMGITQHAVGLVPDPRHGVCTDDVARALTVHLLHADEMAGPVAPAAVRRSLAFLDAAFDGENGRFRNFRAMDGRWLEEIGSEDSHGRALQALGNLIARSRDADPLRRAVALFDLALPAALAFENLRPRCYALLGCVSALDGPGLPRVQPAAQGIGAALAELVARSDAGWPWPERTVTYDNGALPQALIAAGEALKRSDWVALGVERLDWLLDAQTAADGHLSPIGNGGWWSRGGRPARFDQQPIEAISLLEAARAALQATGDPRFGMEMERAYAWFLGSNELGLRIAEPRIGACHDGLRVNGLNPNCGAESTLAWLLAVERIRELRGATRAGSRTPLRTAASLVAASLR